jgi:hypothetical protein
MIEKLERPTYSASQNKNHVLNAGLFLFRGSLK